MKKEKLIIPGSLAAMLGTVFTGNHLKDVKLRDVHPVTKIWKEDRKIGQVLNSANK